MGRFRIRWGDREIEYEGADSDTKYYEALEILRGQAKKNAINLGDEDSIDQESKTRRVASRGESTPSDLKADFVLPAKGSLGILEFGEKEVRFPAKAIDTLSPEEAIGLLLLEISAPIRPIDITVLLSRGFKKIDPTNTRGHLTRSSSMLRRLVIKQGGGYKLTREGEEWVKTVVVPKLTE